MRLKKNQKNQGGGAKSINFAPGNGPMLSTDAHVVFVNYLLYNIYQDAKHCIKSRKKFRIQRFYRFVPTFWNIPVISK